jgi:hypothetical protein
MKTAPPYLPSESQPALTNVVQAVHKVWGEWCGVQTFGQLFDLVLGGADRASRDLRVTANVLYRWLERAVSLPTSKETCGDLGTRGWVLAQRGPVLEFRLPPHVILHPGKEALIARFWVPALLLPEFALGAAKHIGFAHGLSTTAETLRDLGECLVERAIVDDDTVLHIYRLVGQILDQSDSLHEEWLQIAKGLSV